MGVYAGPTDDWWNLTGGTDILRTNIATEKIIQDGLVLNLDAGASSSYPGSGTTWTDLSGNGNNGTLENGVGYTSSNGGSLTFDGGDDYNSFGTSLGNGWSQISVNCWVRPTTFPNTNFGFEKLVSADDGGSGGLESVFNLDIGHFNNLIDLPNSFQGNSIYFGIRTSTQNLRSRPIAIVDGQGSGNYEYMQGLAISVNPPEYAINTWMNLCGVFNSSFTSLYINGVLKSTSNSQPDGVNRSLSGVLNTSSILRTIAASSSGNSRFTGNIAQVSIYNRALTAQEIQQNYNATKSRFQ
jgi:hypothetical protein